MKKDRWGRKRCPTCHQPIPLTTEQRRERQRRYKRRYNALPNVRERQRIYNANYYQQVTKKRSV